jgi:hypothetical protein
VDRDRDVFDLRFKAHLLPLLEACGVASTRVQISYEDYLQDYSVVIDGDDLSDQQMVGLIEATHSGGCLEFASERNRQLFFDVSRKLLKEWSKQRAIAFRLQFPDLPRFDATRQQLSDFVREIEVYCGIEPGSVLRVADGNITVGPTQEIGFGKLGHLMSAISAALEDDDDITIGIPGGMA